MCTYAYSITCLGLLTHTPAVGPAPVTSFSTRYVMMTFVYLHRYSVMKIGYMLRCRLLHIYLTEDCRP